METAGRLFKYLDLHIHTYLSSCAHPEMTPEAIIHAAKAQGIRYLAITDHIHIDTDLSILDHIRAEFACISLPMQVYIGCEADIISVGKSVIDENLVGKVDFVMAAANHFHDPTIVGPATSRRRDVADRFLEMFIYAAGIPAVDVIAHPFYMMPGTYNPLSLEELTDDELMEAAQAAAAGNTAVEISRRALTPDQTPFLVRFYKHCIEAGVKFSVGSDAHQLTDVGRTNILEPLVLELGITDDDIWRPDLSSPSAVDAENGHWTTVTQRKGGKAQ